ncbi:MAG: hypothetical protein DMG26_02050 [Acidobacteria bacterium]|nr:MAG: hypothetical protein DMG26_02050 [Acidobacteriota bacterium]
MARRSQVQDLFKGNLSFKTRTSFVTTRIVSRSTAATRSSSAGRDRLEKFKRAGFNTIETYIFWNYHEPREGQADLSEFEDFVKLVKEMGFWMIARPGPYVCAEWDAGGFPHWVVAKRSPLRSSHPQSIETSQHWFNQALPVIQRSQATTGGPIIMVQIENEYDYCKLPDPEKKEYIRALARMASNAGIDVPLITCWTRQVRERFDPDLARVMDTCNFYPRWNILKEVPPALAKLRKEEPASPLGVTELQGGWFSEFGGKLSVDQDGVDGAQLNMLSKTVIEQGVTYFSYYMGFGGTSFDWAAKRLTTTYDYAAPIREPGGLWEKYYAARGIGASLGMFGDILARADAPENAAQSTNKNVSVMERIGGHSAVVFVRENANAEQRYKMSFEDPASPTRRTITVPRQGELVLGPREMKMFPVRYSTAEVLGYGQILDRHFLVVYDEPGRAAEIALATEHEPTVEGDALYQYWDEDYESVTIGLRVEKTEKILYVNDHLLLVALPRDLALRSWTAEFPPSVVPSPIALEEEETRPRAPKPMTVPFIADMAMLGETGSHHNRIWADLYFSTGERDLMLLLPPLPTKCRVDGVLTDFKYDRHWRTARVRVTTPPLPYRPIVLNEVETWVEKFDPGSGEWLNSPARALEDLGPIPYGYVKYRAEFSASPESRMAISTFADDAKKVFVNGKLVAEASNSKKQVEFSLSGYAQTGTNTLEIAYELFGSPNFGENIGELKGVESVRCGADLQSATAITSWQIQRFPAAMPAATPAATKTRDIDPNFSLGGWSSSTLAEGGGPSTELVPAFTWCRAEFTLEKPDEPWSIPWKLTFEADRDALLYLNGKFVGRYVTIGPQKDFYLPEPYLVLGGKQKNILTVVLAYTDRPQHIRTLRAGPYEEFAIRRTRVEFEW